MSTSLLLLGVALAAAHVRVALTFPPDAGLPPLVVATAAREAAGIWSPYGVAIALADSGALVEPEAMRVTVAAGRGTGDERRQRPNDQYPLLVRDPALGEPLGAVTFDRGIPARVITVFFDELVRLVERTRVAGAASWQWPPLMRERILGRALGRVIAHEIGHIVLQSKLHTPTGLMRPAHGAADLIEPGRQRFLLEVLKKERARAAAGPSKNESVNR